MSDPLTNVASLPRRRRLAACVRWALSLAALGASSPALAEDSTLARCIEANDRGLDAQKQGRLIQARTLLAQCASPSCGADISDACQKGIAEINDLLPTMIFVPKNGAGEDVAGVRLFIDGVPYGDKLDGTAVVGDPGEHEFRFEVAGQPPTIKRFVLRERDKDRHEEVLIGPPAPKPPPANAGSSPPPQVTVVVDSSENLEPKYDSTGSAQRTAGTIVLAVGLPVTIVTTVIYGALAESKWQSAQKDCNGSYTPCAKNSTVQSELHDARSAALSADIWTGAAWVVLIGGIALRVTAPARRLITPPVNVTPAVSDRGAGLLLKGTF